MKALFELEPIGLGGSMEANGRVYYFCSDRCRDTFANIDLADVPHAVGDSLDAIDNTVCDLCGKALN